ncbi:Transposable element Tcb2 transposase [Anthophora plagiata]
MGNPFVFQQDNDPKHSSKLYKGLLEDKEHLGILKIMTWPPQSPDLSPIEHLWDFLDIKAKAFQSTSATHLWQYLQDA